jgi:hypothetical protein
VNPSGSYTVTGIPIPTVTTTYTIVASDGTLNGSNNIVYSPSGGSGGAVDLSACAALGYPNSAYYDATYPHGSNINIANIFHSATPSGMPFGNSSALVIRFTTPALGVNDTVNANFQPWVLPASNNNHQATLGTAPCVVPTANSNLPADWAHASGNGVLKTVLSQTPAFDGITNDGFCNLAFGCGPTDYTQRVSEAEYDVLPHAGEQAPRGLVRPTAGRLVTRFNSTTDRHATRS